MIRARHHILPRAITYPEMNGEAYMRYTLQINTGNFENCRSGPDLAAGIAGMWLEKLHAGRVIYGWHPDAYVSGAVIEKAHRNGAEAYVWLPVFAEAAFACDAFVPAAENGGGRIDAVKGESFEFICPSSEDNIEAALRMLDALTDGARPDGVFLDRIRYPSMAVKSAVFGCMCPRCLAKYEAAGIDIDRLRALAAADDMTPFIPMGIEGTRYRFADRDADLLFAVKRDIITSSVAKLADEIKKRGYKVGLDLFAPALADTVGQDIAALSVCADMIKPMMYYSTTAPAGLPFECAAITEGMRAALARMWGADPADEKSLVSQLNAIQAGGAEIACGTEVNYVKGVCSVKPQDLKRRLGALRDAGFGSAALCWNIIDADRDMLDTAVTMI